MHEISTGLGLNEVGDASWPSDHACKAIGSCLRSHSIMQKRCIDYDRLVDRDNRAMDRAKSLVDRDNPLCRLRDWFALHCGRALVLACLCTGLRACLHAGLCVPSGCVWVCCSWASRGPGLRCSLTT